MRHVALSDLLLATFSGYWGAEPGHADQDVHVVRNGDVKSDSGVRWTALPTRGLSISEIAKSALRSGDVLLTTSGNCGQVAIIDDEPRGVTCATNFVKVLRFHPDIAPRYAWHYMRRQEFRSALQPFIRGTTMKNLATRPAFQSVQLPILPIEEQRRITAILDEADVLRTKRRQVLSQVESLVPSIFVQDFGDPSAPRLSTSGRTLGELATVVTGNTPPRVDQSNFGDAIEWIKSDNLGQSVATRAEEWLSDRGASSARLAPAGSVLVTCIAGSPRSIGKCSLVDRRVAFNQQINAILPSSDLDPIFLLNQLKVAPGLVQQKSTGGMKGLVSKSAFQSIRIMVPPIAQQQQFAGRVKEIELQRERVERALAASNELFASLQSKAFGGGL